MPNSSHLSVIEGGNRPKSKDQLCVVCGKPSATSLQHGKWACSDACCEVIIRGENNKVRQGISEGPLVAETKPADLYYETTYWNHCF